MKCECEGCEETFVLTAQTLHQKYHDKRCGDKTRKRWCRPERVEYQRLYHQGYIPCDERGRGSLEPLDAPSGGSPSQSPSSLSSRYEAWETETMFAPRARAYPIHPTVVVGFSLGELWDDVKSGAKYLLAHDPILQLGEKLAKGENVWQAFKESGEIALEDIRTFGPYLAYIPGIGTAAAMAIAAGVALASGKRIDDIALAAARGALPPGPAQAAFDVANSILHGKSIDDSVIGAFKDVYPPVSQAAVAAIQTAYDLSKGKSLSEAALSGIRDALPDEMKVAFDIGVSIAKGKRVQDALVDGVRGMLPPDYQAAFDAAKTLASGKGLVDAALAAAKAELPAEAQGIADFAADIVKGEKLQDALLDAVMSSVPAEYKQWFNLAMEVEKDILALVGQVKAAIANQVSDAKAAYEAAKKAALSLFSGDIVAKLRAQVPQDQPLALAAFDAGVQFIKGKSIEAVALEAAKGFVPDSLKDTYQKAANVANDVIHGGNIADVAMKTFLAQLPEGAKGYAELAIGIIKGGKVTDAAVAAGKAQLQGADLDAFQKALSLAEGDLKDKLLDGAKSYVKTSADTYAAILKQSDAPEAVYQDVVGQAKTWIPKDASDALAGGVPPSAKAAFQKGLDLAKGKLAHYLAVESLKQLIPAEYQAAFDQAQAFVSKYAPSDISLTALREKLGAAAQHALDGASSLYKSSPPEEAFKNDQAFNDAFAKVMRHQNALTGKGPRTASKVVGATTGAPLTKKVSGPAVLVSRQEANTVEQDAQDLGAAYALVNKTIDHAALRRAALGKVNPPSAPISDHNLRALFEARVKAYQKSDSSAIPIALGVGGLALGYYFIRRH